MHPYLKTLRHKFLKNNKTNSFIQFLNLHQTGLGAQKTVLGYTVGKLPEELSDFKKW